MTTARLSPKFFHQCEKVWRLNDDIASRMLDGDRTVRRIFGQLSLEQISNRRSIRVIMPRDDTARLDFEPTQSE